MMQNMDLRLCIFGYGGYLRKSSKWGARLFPDCCERLRNVFAFRTIRADVGFYQP
jgi:hypothetical protein